MRRRGARAVVAAACAAVVLASCVDHQANAREFCDRHERLLAPPRDQVHISLASDELAEIERDIEVSMRDAEDGTRPVRRAARDLLDAYDELGSLVDDEDAEPDELADARAELLDARVSVRAACGELDTAAE